MRKCCESRDLAKTFLLQVLLDLHRSKQMRVNMKEAVKLESLKKINETRMFSNKKLRLTKESMGTLLKSSEYCGPIRKNSYPYVSGIVGMAKISYMN